MKTETMLYDRLKKIIPENAKKTVLFADVTDTSYEVFFYAYLPEANQPKQCFELAEKGELDENELDVAFESIVNILKQDIRFIKSKTNIFTLIVDCIGVLLEVEYFDNDARLFQIKKDWTSKYLD